MRYIALIGFVGLAASTSAGTASQKHPQSLQRCVAREAEHEGLSGSVLVTEGDSILANVRRGRLAGEASSPIAANTRFNLGSVSKMFTAVAIGQLIEAGKVHLDEPVGQIVHGLTSETGKVTIRQLLTHSSGLGDFFRPENMSAMLKARSATDILPLIAKDKPAFEPGSRFAYSNSGFALLGIIVERVAGMTYGDYLERYVFRPARMINTGLNPKPLATLAVGMTAGGMAAGGDRRELRLIGQDGRSQPPASASPGGPGLVLVGPGGHTIEANAAPAGRMLKAAPGATEGFGSPAGGLFSTGEDMRRFGMALMAGKLLRPSTLLEFTSPQIVAVPATGGQPPKYYGFGFGLIDEDGLRWFGHNGGTLGANAEFWVQPRHQWVVTVLSNRDPPTATAITRWTRRLLEDPGRRAGCSRGGR